MKTIFIFVIPQCRRCTDLMDLMRNESIPFTVILMTMPENRALWMEIKNQCECDNLIFPIFFIRDSNDGSGHLYLPIRDFRSDDEILAILKNNI